MALGACCFFAGFGAGGCSALSPGLGAGVSEGDCSGDSNGSGVAECFFFGCPEGLADGVGEVLAFFALGDGDSSVSGGAFFFLGEAVADGAGDSSGEGDDLFFFGDAEADEVGEGVGVGDFFAVVAVVVFFFRCGVGVGVAKIFLRVLPRDSSAP